MNPKENSVRVPLTQLAVGKSARVAEILDGHGLHGRLRKMGVREGETLKMIHRPLRKGPAVISISRVQIAIGFGMASRILVEPTGH